jgi:5-methylcytosine-specific restriction endonuclease McrA
MTRRSLSARERLRLFNLYGGICHLCETKIDGTREAWEIEHPLALALGGEDDDENMRPAHVKCHKGKSADDIGMIRKADREKARHLGAKPPSRTPLPCGKGSRWKRTIGGRTVLRDQ